MLGLMSAKRLGAHPIGIAAAARSILIVVCVSVRCAEIWLNEIGLLTSAFGRKQQKKVYPAGVPNPRLIYKTRATNDLESRTDGVSTWVQHQRALLVVLGLLVAYVF